MKQQFSVDTSRLNARLAELNKRVPQLVPTLVMGAHDILRPEIDRYLSGPYNPKGKGPGTGGVPIPRVSKRLVKSIQTIVSQDKKNVKIVSSNAIAPHNIYVHFGTKKMQARRFIQDPVTTKTRPILDYWEKEFKKAVGEV